MLSIKYEGYSIAEEKHFEVFKAASSMEGSLAKFDVRRICSVGNFRTDKCLAFRL